MYPFVLAVLLGFFSAQLVNLVIDNIPYVEKVPFLNKANNLFVIVTILLVWITDTSLLHAYGMGSDLRWLDVVGSSFAIVGLTNVLDSISSWFTRD